jgi:hypothetical protein
MVLRRKYLTTFEYIDGRWVRLHWAWPISTKHFLWGPNVLLRVYWRPAGDMSGACLYPSHAKPIRTATGGEVEVMSSGVMTAGMSIKSGWALVIGMYDNDVPPPAIANALPLPKDNGDDLVPIRAVGV